MGGALVMAGVQAGLSILSNDIANKKIEDQANMNFNSTLSTVNQQFGVAINGLKNQAVEIGNQVGAELTSLNYEKRDILGQVVSANVERNIYGQTSQKTQNKVNMSAALAADSIIQKGEAAQNDVQSRMATAKYSRDANVYQASIGRANEMSKMKSAAEMGIDALSAGMSGYSQGISAGMEA